MAPTGLEHHGVDEEDVLDIAENLRRYFSNYNLAFGRLDEDFDLKYLDDNYSHSCPAIIKDKNNKIWVYGQGPDNKTRLTELNKHLFSDIQFPPLGDPDRLDFLHAVRVPPINDPRVVQNFSVGAITEQEMDKIYNEIEAKAGHLNLYHFSFFSAGMKGDKEKEIAISKMSEFLKTNDQLIAFVDRCVNLIDILTDEDVVSLGTENETKAIKEFNAILKELEDHGFHGTRGEKVNFWSGKEAARYSENQPNEISCSAVANMSFLFQFLNSAKGILGEPSNAFVEALSKKYALAAKGDVNVYISSSKPSEDPTLTIGNNFWNAELVTLQEKLRKNEIKSIQIHLYNHKEKKWEKPVDINSKKAHLVLSLIRRYAYQPDLAAIREELVNNLRKQEAEKSLSPAEVASRLKEIDVTMEKYKTLIEGKPPAEKDLRRQKNEDHRKPLPLGSAKKMLMFWKTKASEGALKRSKTQKAASSDPSASPESASPEKASRLKQRNVLDKWKMTQLEHAKKDKKAEEPRPPPEGLGPGPKQP